MTQSDDLLCGFCWEPNSWEVKCGIIFETESQPGFQDSWGERLPPPSRFWPLLHLPKMLGGRGELSCAAMPAFPDLLNPSSYHTGLP